MRIRPLGSIMRWRVMSTALGALCLGALLLGGWAQAATPPGGKIVHCRGSVGLYRAGQGAWAQAKPGALLQEGDLVRTGPDGWAAVLMADETLIQINRDSRFLIKRVAARAGWLQPAAAGERPKVGSSLYRLQSGEIWMRNNGERPALQVETPTISAAVRGTEFDLLQMPQGGATLTVLEGRVAASNQREQVTVAAGEQLVAGTDQSLRKRVLLSPRDAVQWTVAIPPAQDLPGAAPPVLAARQDLSQGRLLVAVEKLDKHLAGHPDDGQAWSLLSLARLLAGRAPAALEAAQRATQAAPRLAGAWLQLALAQQARFDLPAALAATRQALKVEPGWAPALVNLAQLLFASDLTEEAWQAVEQARAQDPRSAPAHTVRGFLLLARQDTAGAQAAFARALNLDPGQGEPHLGLALAAMRQGQVETALEEMGTAVLLEPRRALFMSYWGKMLYQVRRLDRALDVLRVAAVMDPLDPTPHLYRAIILRDLNQPTQAIAALNQAMALNHNRAVYRSRLLLDQDLATKNVGLSILYDQLGLGAWAYNRAMASVKQDYMNYAGHLFVGGALFGLEGRGRAAGSESLLSRLLQPANLNTFNQFNEYTSFFDQPQFNLTTQASVGEHQSHSLLANVDGGVPESNLALAGAVSTSGTQGWRPDKERNQKGASGQLRWDPAPGHGLYLAGSYYDSYQRGPQYPRYEYDDPSQPDQDWNADSYRLEAGYRWRVTPQADLVVFATRYYGAGDFNLISRQYDPEYGFFWHMRDHTDYQEPYYLGQVQYQQRLGVHQLIGGFIYFDSFQEIDNRASLAAELSDGSLTPAETYYRLRARAPRRYATLYLQDVWRLAPSLSLEAALYWDQVERGDAWHQTSWRESQLNPRLGLVWTPTTSDTFRLAAFRYLLPYFTNRVDPMDVAGVTIFRNYWDDSFAREVDLVWEHTWGSGFFSAGLVHMERSYEEKQLREDGGLSHLVGDGAMHGAELVYNQLLWSGWGLAAGYNFIKARDDYQWELDRRDHRAALRLTWVHPCGFSAGVTETYRYLDFLRGRQDESMWITDAWAGWEFPGKRGAIKLLATNLLDEHFNWVTDYMVFLGRDPARQLVLTVSLYF